MSFIFETLCFSAGGFAFREIEFCLVISQNGLKQAADASEDSES